MIEIKIRGKGGQGAVLAAKLLADAVAKNGYQVQSFASYGGERRGGKVESYIRVSEEDILVHSKVYKPDYTILMAESLATDPDTLQGLTKGCWLLINSPSPPEAFSSIGDFKIVTVDADRIAKEHGVLLPSSTPIINTTILGAILGIAPVANINDLIKTLSEAALPDVAKNISAAQEAYHTVKYKMPDKIEKSGKGVDLKASLERQPRFQLKQSPCEANCPAGHSIRKTISFIQNNNFKKALENIKLENPFPGICGRVCFHSCETYCNRNDYDYGITIQNIERAIFDYSDKYNLESRVPKRKTGKRVAIIGSGPAGMSCAYFSAILGHDVTLFEALPVLGGILSVGIPEYRLPKNVTVREIEQIIELGIKVRTNTAVGKDVLFEDILKEYDASFIATGVHKAVRLNIPGEDNEKIIQGLEFLKQIALGSSVYLGSRVTIIGGGNVAIDTARTAKRLGASDVQIICLESMDIMPAYKNEIDEAIEEGIQILEQTEPIKIYDFDTNTVSIECVKVKGGKREKSGWLQWPDRIDGTNFIINTDSIIIAIGGTLESTFLPDTMKIQNGLIKIDCLGRTSIAGIYAGGDVTMFDRSVVEAIASGKRSAVGIDLYLMGRDERQMINSIDGEENITISMENYLAGDYTYENIKIDLITLSDLNTHYFPKLSRAKLHKLDVLERIANFNEINLGFAQAEAIEEANRCFQCGNCNLCGICYLLCPDIAIMLNASDPFFTINYDRCRGCGVCIEECPRKAMALE